MPTISMRILPYAKCKHDLIVFRNANRDTTRDESYFDWRYLNGPRDSATIIVWAEDSSGKKVGSFTISAHHYMAGNATYIIGRIGDISVAEDCRGMGVAQQMFKYIQGLEEVMRFDACLAFPNEGAARSLEKAGWTTVSTIERHVKFLNAEALLKKICVMKPLHTVLRPFFNNLLKCTSYETFLWHTPGYNGELIYSFDERFDALWNDFKKKDMIINVRDNKYLVWRYSMHPLTRFCIYTLTKGNALCGYVIFNIEGDTCNISDLISRTENGCPTRLMSYFLKHMKKNSRVSSIVVFVNKDLLTLMPLARFGFFKRPDNLRVMVGLDKKHIFAGDRKWYLAGGDKTV